MSKAGILKAAGIDTAKKQRIWEDDDDEGASKVKAFQTSNALPSWAKMSSSSGRGRGEDDLTVTSRAEKSVQLTRRQKLLALAKKRQAKKLALQRAKRAREGTTEDGEADFEEEEEELELEEETERYLGEEIEDGDAEGEILGGEAKGSSRVLGEILRSTAPILHSKHQRKETLAPRVSNLIAIKQDHVRALEWHKSGELLVVTGSRHIHLHHVGGNHHERLNSWPIKCTMAGKEGKKGHQIEEARLVAGHDSLMIRCEEVYVPQLMDLATGSVTVLSFLDPRQGSSFRLTSRGRAGKEKFLEKFACNHMAGEESSSQRVAVACGQNITIGSLTNGTISNRITLNDDVSDLTWAGGYDLYAAAGNRVLVYDTRNSSRPVNSFVDQGSLKITSINVSPANPVSKYLAVGSTSGVVNCYQLGKYDAPLKSYMNLSTAVDSVDFGSWTDGEKDVLTFRSASEHNGLRLAKLPAQTVVPSFPNIGMKHSYIQHSAINPKVPILSIGDHGRITNYQL